MEKRRSLLTLAITLLVFVLCLLLVLRGVSTAGEARKAEALRVTEDSLHRAVMSCYALEGRYPPTLEYLVENYGVYVDEESYFVDYEIFATNLMPEITVVEKGT